MHIISTRGLREQGVSQRKLNAALRSGALSRIRRGWYCTPEAHESVVRAVRAGGALTCVSALSLHGVWTMPDPFVHVRIARGVKAIPSEGVRIHWSDARKRESVLVDPVDSALRIAFRCADLRAAVVALDSAMNQGLISAPQAAALAAGSRARHIVGLTDASSQSGLETLVRLALRRRGITVRTQVRIEGVGRVDLLVGDRLVIELDGRAWHDRAGDFDRDRRRDQLLVARGYAVMRASYSQVMEWVELEQSILAVVRRGGHRWPRRRS
jgi:very-short-patch-repair endonuclease